VKRAVLLLAVCVACSRSPESSPPVVAVEPAGSTNRIDTAPPNPSPPEDPPGGCESSFVEVIDGSKTARFVLGRELAGTDRGATHAYVEEVIHQNGQIVLHLEGLSNPDLSGSRFSLTVLDFAEPKSLPAKFEHGYAEYAAEGTREVRRINEPGVEITKWGPEGAWVEGTFGAGSAPPVMSAVPFSVSSAPPPRASGSSSARPPPRMIPTVPYRGRFRVCRSKDWRVRH
jgi:hypothetical protein